MTALWSGVELSAALNAAPSKPPSTTVSGVSIDSRTLQAGDLFFAIRGEAHDGHDHVARAFEAGAAATVVSRERAHELAAFGPVFAVADTLKAMEALGVAARSAFEGEDRRGDRFGRQDHGQGDAARDADSLRRDACFSGFLQQSLGRAADARANAGARPLRRVRDGHESRGRNHAAHPHGAAARSLCDDDRPGPHRISRLDRSDRRREGGDLPWPRASRNSGLESRRPAIRTPGESRRGSRRAGPELWPRRGLRCSASRCGGDRGRLAREGACARPRR